MHTTGCSKRVNIARIYLILLLSCIPPLNADAFLAETPSHPYRITRRFPHSTDAWTQGLVYSNGFLYESTGKYGKSSIRRVHLITGRIERKILLSPIFYGEGLTLMKDHLYQLTWKNKVGFIYNAFTLKRVKIFIYPWEGWGLTHDGRYLIMSDGSPVLHFLDPETLQEIRRITVTENGQPVRRINELEYIHDKIYANVWKTNKIVIIDPESGNITAQLDLSGILGKDERPPGVLNGIAHDPVTKRLFVTGKWWPFVFEIEELTSQPPPGTGLP